MKKCLLETISLYKKAEKNIIKEGQQTIRSMDPSDPNIVPADQMLFDEENNAIYYDGEKYEIPSEGDETMPIDSEFLRKIQKELDIK